MKQKCPKCYNSEPIKTHKANGLWCPVKGKYIPSRKFRKVKGGVKCSLFGVNT